MTSGGTLYSVAVAVPTAVPLGSIAIAYVPVTGSTVRSRKTPLTANGFVTRTVPSGRSSETVPLEMVTPPSWSATAWPAAPGKVSTAFCPGTVVATATAGPPG